MDNMGKEVRRNPNEKKVDMWIQVSKLSASRRRGGCHSNRIK